MNTAKYLVDGGEGIAGWGQAHKGKNGGRIGFENKVKRHRRATDDTLSADKHRASVLLRILFGFRKKLQALNRGELFDVILCR
jgi:hypothetical protein